MSLFSGARVRLRPGLRVSDRTDDTVQVGLHDGRRAALPEEPPVRALLSRLSHGVSWAATPPDQRDAFERLARAGLLVPHDDGPARARARAAARVLVDAEGTDPTAVSRLLSDAGLAEGRRPSADVTLVLRVGHEPRRDELDALVRADRPHLLVTAVAGGVRVGPCVAPGVTACVRCVDAHLTDADPRHPLVVEQHLEHDPLDRPPAALLQLALAWAVRDLVALVEGDRPATWSASVDLDRPAPDLRRWPRHPRCGCAWDALT